jgi:hypothetical protein
MNDVILLLKLLLRIPFLEMLRPRAIKGSMTSVDVGLAESLDGCSLDAFRCEYGA